MLKVSNRKDQAHERYTWGISCSRKHKGHKYLLVEDYYSNDVEICLVYRGFNTAETIPRMKKVFSTHGICDTLITNSGPQFASTEIKEFAVLWGFEHVTSSRLCAQSNGEVERAVLGTVLEYLALLTNRDTPLPKGYSPAQLSTGRKLKNSSTLQSGQTAS